MKAKVISNGSILSYDCFPPPWTQLGSYDSEKRSSLAQKRVCLKPPTWAAASASSSSLVSLAGVADPS